VDPRRLSITQGEALERRLDTTPVQASTGLWMFRGEAYEADPDLTAEDVRALLLARQTKRRRAVDRAHAIAAMEDEVDLGRREPIPQDVKIAVWRRNQDAACTAGVRPT
jgi:hypothetical protein